MSSDIGKEPITLVEIDQPRCSLTYGTAPCAAVLGTTGQRKCFNTRNTCQSTATYTPTDIITLRFVKPQVRANDYAPCIPALDSYGTAPLTINLGGMEKSLSALGQRENVTIKIKDFQHSDTRLDKYRLERYTGAADLSGAYDPYKRGTFWGKWLNRNKYYTGFTVRVREGYVGDLLAAMRTRVYVLDRIDGPNNGMVSITAKDLFSLIEARKSVAPLPNLGELFADITIGATSLQLSPAGIGSLNYPISGYASIGDEVVSFTRMEDVMTIVRGQLNTSPATHNAGDAVQVVLQYATQPPHDIIYNLLTQYSAVPASLINRDEWNTLMTGNVDFYSANIAKPEPVADLIGELCEQAGITIWPDVETGMVKVRALRSSAPVATLTDRKLIDCGTKRDEAKRVSQCWVNYAIKNPTLDVNDPKSYRSRLVVESNGSILYGTETIREVFSRWIPVGGRTIAQRVTDRLLAMFKDPPLVAQFPVTIADGTALDLADYVNLQPLETQDDTGAQASTLMAITELDRTDDMITVTAQQVAFPATDTGGGSTNRVYIENDILDVNLYSMYTTLFGTPVVGGLPVEFVVLSGVTVGSSSEFSPAIQTGTWPAGVVPKLINHGRIQGKGGNAGQGGLVGGVANSGNTGGTAFAATSPIIVDNTDGKIWGGGGGGGGGGWGRAGGRFGDDGGGGGGGAGRNVGNGAYFGGTAGAIDTGGIGGSNGSAGKGGDGGTPGVAGGAGASGTGSAFGAGAAGGAAGNSVTGTSNITWLATGSRLGPIT